MPCGCGETLAFVPTQFMSVGDSRQQSGALQRRERGAVGGGGVGQTETSSSSSCLDVRPCTIHVSQSCTIGW